MYSCYIIDDEPYSVNAIKEYVDKIPDLICIGSKLPTLDYIRIHRSCAVNKSFIKYIENNTIVMHNGDRLPISLPSKKALIEKIKSS